MFLDNILEIDTKFLKKKYENVGYDFLNKRRRNLFQKLSVYKKIYRQLRNTVKMSENFSHKDIFLKTIYFWHEFIVLLFRKVWQIILMFFENLELFGKKLCRKQKVILGIVIVRVFIIKVSCLIIHSI